MNVNRVNHHSHPETLKKSSSRSLALNHSQRHHFALAALHQDLPAARGRWTVAVRRPSAPSRRWQHGCRKGASPAAAAAAAATADFLPSSIIINVICSAARDARSRELAAYQKEVAENAKGAHSIHVSDQMAAIHAGSEAAANFFKQFVRPSKLSRPQPAASQILDRTVTV